MKINFINLSSQKTAVNNNAKNNAKASEYPLNAIEVFLISQEAVSKSNDQLI